MQKMTYLLMSQHVWGIIMPIVRRKVQNRQRLWCTALAVLQKTHGEEMVGVHLLGMVLPFPTRTASGSFLTLNACATILEPLDPFVDHPL
jgi:hypothetical protein